ncbi:MAG TPA: PepSY domain-containing protein [Nitrobacter sp.]|nr:PepSY domain-containing protein [Nitrobacter sp.]
MKRSIIALALMSATALGGGAALASDHAEDQAEIALFQQAAHDIRAAIATAEGATGGTAVEAEFTEEDGAPMWEVKTVAGTTRAEVNVDPATGQVVKTSDKDEGGDGNAAVTPEMLGAPLADLVTRAEAAGGGKVMSIDYEHENGQAVGAEVEIVNADGTVHEFLMNPADGTLTPIVAGQDRDEGGDDGEDRN